MKETEKHEEGKIDREASREGKVQREKETEVSVLNKQKKIVGRVIDKLEKEIERMRMSVGKEREKGRE